MTTSDDPFKYHPELRDKIADPLKSRFRDGNLADMDEKMRAAGAPPNWRISDEAREASRVETLRGYDDGDIWVFGYGSLIWDPGLLFDQVRVANLNGFHRRFCLRSELGRGSPEKPGLMVALDRGGECASLIFRIPHRLIEQETRILWKREVLRLSYQPQFVPVKTAVEDVMALAFVIDPAAENYQANLDPELAAHYVATGEGLYGTSLNYVENLVSQLAELGIDDQNVSDLCNRARQLNDPAK